MAITIEQQPASPNYSIGELVYVLSSDNVTEPQFSYVIDITVGTDTFRYRKQSNPTSRGIIDISRIANDNLEYELGALGVTSIASAINQSKSFSAVFSEEFLQGGVLNVLNPTSAQSVVVLKGVRESDTGLLTSAIDVAGTLSDVPATGITVHRDDTPVIAYYDTSTNVIDYQPITVPLTGDSVTEAVNGVSYTFSVTDDENVLGREVFWWFNRKGGLDWFTFDEAGTKQTNVDKTSTNVSRITHGFTTSSNREPQNSNVFKSSSNTFRIDYSEVYNKDSRWLDLDTSNFVSGIFDSPVVYKQEGSIFRPVNIMNSSYDSRTEMRDQELFNYSLEYQYINDKRNI